MSESFGRRFERKETPSEHLIVEVGSGSLPIFVDVAKVYREEFDRDPLKRYVGVDINVDELQYGKKLQETHDTSEDRALNDRIHYVQAQAEALPFADSSVNELILRNVLGDPDIPVEEKHAALHEAARVLKPGAILRVIEVYTPLMVHEDDLYAYIDDMQGKPFVLFTEADSEALPEHEEAADRSLSKDEAAGTS